MAHSEPDEKVPGEGNAFERQPDAPPEFHVQHGERDRYAGASVDDFVQIAVARVVVVLGIAGKAELLEHIGIQREQLFFRCPASAKTRAQHLRQALQGGKVGIDIEIRVGVLGDHQAGTREIDPPFPGLDVCCEGGKRHRSLSFPAIPRRAARSPASACRAQTASRRRAGCRPRSAWRARVPAAASRPQATMPRCP